MTRAEFTPCLAVLSAATGHAFTADQATVWFDLMRDLDVAALQAAVKRVLLEREYPGLPPLGQIRRYATEATHGTSVSAVRAFARVHEAISQFGYLDPAGARKYLGPEIWAVVQGIAGWDRICDSPIDQRASLFAQFRDGWNRQEDRRANQLRLPEALRPTDRIGERPEPHPAVRLLADSLGERTA
ncbi:MAG: hypothetical protein AB7U20_20415 [Planctomycetaceae bacterium]